MTRAESPFGSWAAMVNASLRSYLGRIGGPPRIREAIQYCVFPGGKRIRPAVTLAVAQALGGRIPDAMPSACAVELVHCYSLVHDDLPCMDDDDFRRGKPSCHKKFDEATAVLAGDAMLGLAFEFIARYTPQPSRVAGLVRELALRAGPAGMVGGQVLDLAPRRATLHLVREIHEKKTAAMFVASARLGALSAGAGPKALEALGRYGYNLGMLFQSIDDLLDLGEEGRRTMPGVLGPEGTYRQSKAFASRAEHAIIFLSSRGSRLKDIVRFVFRQAEPEKWRSFRGGHGIRLSRATQ